MPDGVDDWYRDAIIYELHVRTFFDGNGDGVGDFQGLRQKLPYLKDLGVTALWLLPFYPSPGRDDGYDIADYTAVHPDYGTLTEFRAFLREAHQLGLKVITELVINHTSDQHPWFERARHAKPGTAWRNFYVWSDTADRYRDARIIFPDFERSNWTWDPVAGQYYWHRFYSHQPDLNFDSPAVRRAVLKTVDFWLGMGVDGLRLDAVPYLFEREGTSCENLPETHAYLKELRAHVDEHFPHRMLLAEANQWPEDAVAYFGAGDECHMAFHFPLMPRLFMALYQENRQPIVDILEETPPLPEGGQWALFLRNHDELTLEMVTEQERDYMYQAYAEDPRSRINLGIRRRLMPLLNNNRRRAELMHALLLALPGTPVLYYGNEIGMGDNIYLGDRDGVRTPFQWSGDKNAGFSSANPQKLVLPVVTDPEYHYEAVNAEAQRRNPHSLWWWLKRLIALRRSTPAFGRGRLDLVEVANPHVLAFVRTWPDTSQSAGADSDTVLVVANLSRFSQLAELDLSPYQGAHLVEMFGRTPFPAVGDALYPITLGPHGFYYFRLDAAESRVGESAPLPRIDGIPALVRDSWVELLSEGPHRRTLEAALTRYLTQARWFGGRSRRVARCQVDQALTLAAFRILDVRITYQDGGQERYQMPLGWSDDPTAHDILEVHTENGLTGFVCDAGQDPEFSRAVLGRMLRRGPRAQQGFAVWTHAGLQRRWHDPDRDWTPHPLSREQSNTSVRLGNSGVLKLYRRLERGPQPDWEMTHFLNTHGYPHVPVVLATLDVDGGTGPATTLAALTSYVEHECDAWEWACQFAERYLADPAPAHLDAFLPWVSLLAERTAELHHTLLAATSDPAFKAEPMTPFVRRSFYQGIRQDLTETLRAVAAQRSFPDAWTETLAHEVLDRRSRLAQRAEAVLDAPLNRSRSRIHGDYHLGQVLFTGDDFVLIDFEGEPRRRLSERRLKSLPVRDVAGMVRSLHYAAFQAVGREGAEDSAAGAHARHWYQVVSSHFIAAYEQALPMATSPGDPWLQAFLLEKAAYEARYELAHRPDWAWLPLMGLLELADTDAKGGLT